MASGPWIRCNRTRLTSAAARLPAAAARLTVTRPDREERQRRLAEARKLDVIPYAPIPASAAHPPPLPLVFRFYVPDAAHVDNSPFVRGFIASIFVNGRISDPLPHDAEYVFTVIRGHLNRETNPGPSPFISVSVDFFWTLLTAGKAREDSGRSKDVRLSIVDGIEAAGPDGRHQYHPAPYSAQFRDRKEFTNGSWRLAGDSELLIWGRIPPSAIIADFSIADFVAKCGTDARWDSVFRPSILCSTGGSILVRDRLKVDSPKLELDTCLVLAEMAATVCSSRVRNREETLDEGMLTQIVGNMICGWHLRPSGPLSTAQWRDMAYTFARGIVDKQGRRTLPAREAARAFLWGFVSGCGHKDWQIKGLDTKILLVRAQRFGLTDPDAILVTGDNPIVALIQGHRYIPRDSVERSQAVRGSVASVPSSTAVVPRTPTQRTQTVARQIMEAVVIITPPTTPERRKKTSTRAVPRTPLAAPASSRTPTPTNVCSEVIDIEDEDNYEDEHETEQVAQDGTYGDEDDEGFDGYVDIDDDFE